MEPDEFDDFEDDGPDDTDALQEFADGIVAAVELHHIEVKEPGKLMRDGVQ